MLSCNYNLFAGTTFLTGSANVGEPGGIPALAVGVMGLQDWYEESGRLTFYSVKPEAALASGFFSCGWFGNVWLL